MATITTLLLVPQAFDRACERMQQAQQAYTEALNALAEATCSLEFRRAEYLAKGVEGKNAEVREAKLRLLLFDEYAEQLGLEVSLNEARRDLETTRLEWDALRYKLGFLKVQRALEGAT